MAVSLEELAARAAALEVVLLRLLSQVYVDFIPEAFAPVPLPEGKLSAERRRHHETVNAFLKDHARLVAALGKRGASGA